MPRLRKLPAVPRVFFPRPGRVFSGSSDGLRRKGVRAAVAAEEYDAHYLMKVSDNLRDNVPFSLSVHSPVVRNHGCMMCPYWGSSRCYHDLVPPRTHTNGMCRERLLEVVSYARQSKTFTGKEAKREEVVHKIANHILLLESHLIDYRSKKLSQLAEQKGLEPGDPKLLGVLHTSEFRFDAYETQIMGQLNKLTDLFAGYMKEDLSFELKKGAHKQNDRLVSPLDVGVALRLANAADEGEDVPVLGIDGMKSTGTAKHKDFFFHKDKKEVGERIDAVEEGVD